MDCAELMAHVMRAVDTLYARDSDLFTLDASEWSIAHRLAVYLEQGIPGWNVDCEYNRQGPNRKPKAVNNEDKVRPDIILHHRGRMEDYHNLLIVEVKKRESDEDMGRAREFTKPPEGAREFQYQFGLALSVVEGPELHWFSAGEEIT